MEKHGRCIFFLLSGVDELEVKAEIESIASDEDIS
jgi:hypothetical protein